MILRRNTNFVENLIFLLGVQCIQQLVAKQPCNIVQLVLIFQNLFQITEGKPEEQLTILFLRGCRCCCGGCRRSRSCSCGFCCRSCSFCCRSCSFRRSSCSFRRCSGSFRRCSGNFRRSSCSFRRSSCSFRRSSCSFCCCSCCFRCSGRSICRCRCSICRCRNGRLCRFGLILRILRCVVSRGVLCRDGSFFRC